MISIACNLSNYTKNKILYIVLIDKKYWKIDIYSEIVNQAKTTKELKRWVLIIKAQY